MSDSVACLTRGKVKLLHSGRATEQLQSPYQQQMNARSRRDGEAVIVSVTRGRVPSELCYAVRFGTSSALLAQVPGTGREQTLCHSDDLHVAEIDYSFADEALACTVRGERGTSAIGVFQDDGKGVRTVTEGDVIDRWPRFVPGGRQQIMYSSAGIGRTKSGAWAGLAPFSLHCLRFADSSVEVLVADAKYDYSCPVPVSAASLYALRSAYQPPTPPSLFKAILRPLSARADHEATLVAARDLVFITEQGTEMIAQGVRAFTVDEARNEILYADETALFRMSQGRARQAERIAELESIEQIVIA